MSSASSSSSSSNNRWNHDVFLSFRGADTRNTFTGHLYKALHEKGINVFIDNELERGAVITSQLLQLIEDSRISILILSENYASSSFCLDELAKVMECRETKKQTVIPVFYHVDPTHVEEQTGTFGLEFAQLEAQFITPNLPMNEMRINNEEATERVRKWRLALTNVARLSGWHLEKGHHEATIIHGIVELISKRLDRTPLHVAAHPIGLASRVDSILGQLNFESDDVCVLGLHGMGGIGKTTTAKALYNRCAGQFEFDGMCFLLNVRESSKKDGLAKLQETLLFEILGDQKNLMGNYEKGIELIKQRLGGKRVLIVIDDVDNIEQLEILVGGIEWFSAGSIIIITTRDLHLLKVHGVTRVQEIKKLGNDEAMELFSWHAFKKAQPSEAYMELSSLVVGYAQGHPLALKVLGSSLYGREVPEWEDVLKQLRRCSDDKIIDVLKVSYDGLKREEKVIFLDIAIFFKGKNKNEVTEFLKTCGFGAYIGIQRLIEKSLVYDSCRALEMHDLLESMATQIAFEESSRLCIQKREDIPSLQYTKDKSPHVVEGILLDFDGEEELTLDLSEFIKLRILVIRNGRITKVPKLPNNLRWLEWHNCSLESIPLGFLPAELVFLKMPCSSIVHLKKSLTDYWKAKKFINLTHMNFNRCEYLREIVDLPAIPNLQVLELRGCKKLKHVDKSVGNLKKLESLNLTGCCSLTSLPSLVENPRLESIYLSHCSKLKNLPNLPTTITKIFLSGSGIKEIPSFIGNLTNLFKISATQCKNLSSVSNSIYKLPCIARVDLGNCSKILKFPEDESSMVSSSRSSIGEYKLYLSENKFVSLPVNFFKFIQITELSLNRCEWLVEIPELPPTLQRLNARNCKSLVRFSQFQFDFFNGDFANCHKLVENEMQRWGDVVQNLSLTGMEDNPRRQYSIILPRSEIPEWFSYAFELESNSPSFKLPSPVLSDNLIGIAWCVVFQNPQNHMSSRIQFSVNDIAIASSLYLYGTGLESEHMWLCFYTGFHFPLLQDEEISCKFDCINYPIVFKRFGVHLIYKS